MTRLVTIYELKYNWHYFVQHYKIINYYGLLRSLTRISLMSPWNRFVSALQFDSSSGTPMITVLSELSLIIYDQCCLIAGIFSLLR